MIRFMALAALMLPLASSGYTQPTTQQATVTGKVLFSGGQYELSGVILGKQVWIFDSHTDNSLSLVDCAEKLCEITGKATGRHLDSVVRVTAKSP